MSTTIEATCTTCGTINRVGEADVPPGTKFVPCVSCKSRVALPPMKASRAAPPPMPGGSEIGLADLPAPKRGPQLPSEPSRPAPRSGLAAAADADLPAPRVPRSIPSIPSPPSPGAAAGNFDLDDLMPGAPNLAELPVPKTGGGSLRGMDVADLPAPRMPTPKPRALPDLPAMPGVADLPAPSSRGPVPRPSPAALPSVGDLPAAKPNLNISDLPAPVAKAPPRPTPMPKGITDLPTPRVGITDLPTPKGPGGITDLPTPKGLSDLPTPKNISDVPAPKGFFDDLPQPARSQSQTKNPDLPAPKGFFDDLPGRVNTNKPEVPAPKGFFEDLPGRVNQHGRPAEQAEVAPKGFFDDLPQPAQVGKPALPRPVNTPIELNAETDMLDLGLAEPSHAGRIPGQFDNVDLKSPTMPPQNVPAGGINFKPADQRTKADSIQPLPPVRQQKGQSQSLELEEPRHLPGTQKLGPQKQRSKASDDPVDAARRMRRMRLLMLVGLLVVAAGSVGFYVYRRWAAKKALANTVSEKLAIAKSTLASSDAGHWSRTMDTVREVLELDKDNAEAHAIGSEALLASAIATGINMQGKTTEARDFLQKTLTATVSNASLTRARGLNALTQNDGEAGINFLKPLAEGKDPQASLYVGWAYVTHGEAEPALKAFDGAIAGAGEIRMYGLYGRANVKLSTGDIAGAKVDFDAVLAINKDFVPAMIGQAAAYPATRAQEQEKDLEGILVGRKDTADADVRAQVRAWILMAEAAKRGNRLDASRDRYRKAMALVPDDVGAISGLADVELRDGKIDAAADQIKHALDISKDDIRAQLVQAEISIARKDYPDAKARLGALANRNPQPPATDQAKIKLSQGHLADAESDDNAAVEFYKDAAKLAGDTDLAPTLAAVGKLGQLADKVDNAKAVEYRNEANKMLSVLEAGADKDPQTALTLGMAYMRTNDPAKAEPWLRKYADARPDDAEGQYQLAKALARQGQTDDAINRLIKAQGLAPARAELGIELALTYERAGRDDKAAELYEKLLKDKDPGVELRFHAGRFYARKGDIDKAAEQGKLILIIAPNHVGGMYLKGEGELKNNRVDEARALFGKAATIEREAIYYDALGRANEAKAVQSSNDSKMQQAAIDAYTVATNIEPKTRTSWVGIGRILVAQKQFDRAVEPLYKAWNLDKTDPEVALLMGRSYFETRQVGADQVINAANWLLTCNKVTGGAGNMWAHYYLGQLYGESQSGKQGKASADAFHTATAIARAYEKAGKDLGGFPLREALYEEGSAYNNLGDPSNLVHAKCAWEQYLATNPDKTSQHWKTVNYAMGTGLADKVCR